MIPENRRENITNKRDNESNNTKILIFFNTLYLSLIFCIAVLYYLNLPVVTNKIIFIPKGSTSSIVTHLNKNGYEMNIIDEIILKSGGFIQSGWIDVEQTRLTKMDFLIKLLTSKAALKTITLIPGETSYFFLKKIAEEFNLDENKLQKIYDEHAYKLDGNILADSYSLPVGMSEEYILFYLFSQTNKKYEEFSKKIFGKYDKEKWFRYISLASVIQKEAATTNEMPIIASVVHNRLKKNMALQMDGTLNYGKYSNSVVTADRIRNDETSYNTYKNKGLPKIESIRNEEKKDDFKNEKIKHPINPVFKKNSTIDFKPLILTTPKLSGVLFFKTHNLIKIIWILWTRSLIWYEIVFIKHIPKKINLGT